MDRLLRHALVPVLCGLSPALALVSAASAAPVSHVTVVGRFTPAADNLLLPNKPRGRAVLHQARGAAGKISGTISVTGLAPGTQYVTVPYVDPLCTPAPGVTAYPSSIFVTNASGAFSGPITVNPSALNPLATFDLSQTRSFSIRQVVSPGPPTVPSPVFETCDGAPVIR